MRECDDVNRNNKDDICKAVNRKDGLSGQVKFYASECGSEGTGYEPPVLVLRLDTPVIVYQDYIIIDRFVYYIFREVFAQPKQTPKLRVLIHQHLNISTTNKRFVVVKRRLSVLTTLANIKGLNLTNLFIMPTANEIAAKQAEEAAKKAAEEARKAAEEAANNGSADENLSASAKTREQIIAEMKANDANFIARVTINGINASERVAENGYEYNNLMLLLNKPVKASISQKDGSRQMGFTQSLQVSEYQLTALMRRHPFYGRFVSMVENAIAAGMPEPFFCGMEIQILAEFIPAGVVASNPFTRNANEYGVKEYDRYIYHVIEVYEPTDVMLLEEYKAMAIELRKMMLDEIKAAKAAKVQRASLLASIASTAENLF